MKIYIALENLRSLYNIGAIIRTSEFYGTEKVFLIGYSGIEHRYSTGLKEQIIVHQKLTKTSLGTIEKIKIEHFNDIEKLHEAYPQLALVAVEQSVDSINLYDWNLKNKEFDNQEGLILILGNEVEGITKEALKICNKIIEIPRLGTHPSLNVEAAAAIAISYAKSNLRQMNEESSLSSNKQ